MLAMAFQECKADEKNPNDKEFYNKDYEDEEYYGWVYRCWIPADKHGPNVESIYYTLWSKTVGRKGFQGCWYPSNDNLCVNRCWPTAQVYSLREHEFKNDRYYSPVPPERRVGWEANPTRPKSF